MNDRQLIADLLSALEYHTEQTRPIEFSRVAIEAAREYLRKPAQQEPVAWMDKEKKIIYWHNTHETDDYHGFKRTTPLYESPQPSKPWVGLTDDEVKHQWEIWRASIPRYVGFAKGIDAKLREKNT